METAINKGRELKPEHRDILERAEAIRFVPAGEREVLFRLLQPEQYGFGDLIVRQGDPADSLFLLVSGRARVVKTTPDGQELSLNLLKVGDGFGESSLLQGGVRVASVRCSSAVEVLKLSQQDFLSLTEQFPDFRKYFELTVRWRSLHGFLYEFSNFGRLPKPAIHALIERLEEITAPRGKLLFQQGDPAGAMYIIQKGRVRIYNGNNGDVRNLAFLREGDFFGELSILNGTSRAASAQAAADCRLLALSPQTVRDLSSQFPEFAGLLEERRAQYRADVEARVPLDFTEETLPAETAVADKLALPESEAAGSEASAHEEPFADEDGHFRKRGRIWRMPFIAQIDEADCGAASLAMICRYYGRKVSLTRVRQLCHTGYDGTSLKAISHAANELGLASRALKVSYSNLPQMPLPAIIHWEGNHWVVLYHVDKKFVRVADPATGPRRIPRAEFEQKWTGYAALFDYTTDFGKAPEAKTNLAWLWPFLAQHRTTLFQVTALAGIAVLLQLLFPVFTQVVVDKVIVEQDLGLLKILVLAMVVAGGFLLATNLIQQYLLSFVAVRMDVGMLDLLMRRLLALPMSYFHNRRTGDIQRRLQGAQLVRLFMVEYGIGAILAVAQWIGCTLLMGVYSLTLLTAFLAVLPLYIALMYLSVRVLRPIFSELEEAYGKYSSSQIDAIKGIEAVKAAAAETAFRDGMLNEFSGFSGKIFKGNFVAMAYETGVQTVGLLSTVLFLYVGGMMVIDGKISIGSFVAFSTLLAMASAAVLRVLTVWDQMQRMVVLLYRMNDVFDHEPEQGSDRSRLRPVPTLEGHLELRNLGFRYGGPEAAYVLKGIDLEIPAGKTFALVGRSGCGKTTLIKLIAGLMEPTEGTILFDHLELRTLNYRDVRRKIGVVLQENHLFNDTILRNISFGDPEPDFDRVLRAAQLANAHEFITRLPLGYETKVGETGLAISGGQKQRICIARAIYHDPPILIFDEATSALDTESERAIQDNLARMLAGRTCIVIAHRLSTIRNADKIVVLEKGQVAEIGSHDELMARRGLYFYLSSQQMGI